MNTLHTISRPNSTRISWFLLCAGVALLSGCQKRPFSYDKPEKAPVYLSIAEANWDNQGSTHIITNSETTAPSTRAFLSGNGNTTQFSVGDCLGLFVRGNGYEPVNNRKVTYTGESELKTKWTISGNAIGLSETQASLTAYFPYNEEANNFNAIPIHPGPYDVNTNDLVWQRDEADYENDVAMFLGMQHALCRIKLNIANATSTDNPYTGDGVITQVIIEDRPVVITSGDVIFTYGELDLEPQTPTVKNTTSGQIISTTQKTLPKDGSIQYDFLLIPIPTLPNEGITLELTIDGKVVSEFFPINTIQSWEAGKAYSYNITIHNFDAQVVFESAKVTAWNEGVNITGELNGADPEYGGGDVEDWGQNDWGTEVNQ